MLGKDGPYYIDPTQLQVLSDGSLPRGYYWYRVVAILPSGNLDLASTLKVYAPHRNNTVGIFWDDVPEAKTYKVFRRTENGEEGSILIDSPAFFFDNGLIEFNDTDSS